MNTRKLSPENATLVEDIGKDFALSVAFILDRANSRLDRVGERAQAAIAVVNVNPYAYQGPRYDLY